LQAVDPGDQLLDCPHVPINSQGKIGKKNIPLPYPLGMAVQVADKIGERRSKLEIILEHMEVGVIVQARLDGPQVAQPAADFAGAQTGIPVALGKILPDHALKAGVEV